MLKSGRFILGPEVAAFEQEVAEYLGCRHAVGVNSGTDALVIALRALGVGPGDEVVTSPFTFFATAEAISNAGAVPVFADIDPATYNIDPVDVVRRLTERTRALLPVHLFGRPAPMEELDALAKNHRLQVVEDAAQAFGATCCGRRVGTLGDAGAFSFFPSKPLSACGDGGLLVTNADGVAEEARKLRAHGARRKYFNETLGYNSRLDELQAAILRVKLPHIERQNAGRQRVAEAYRQLLAGVPGIVLPAEPLAGQCTVVHQYTIRVLGGRRDQVRDRLSAAGVEAMVYYPTPLHLLPPYAGRNDRLPQAEQASREVLSLPMWPEMDLATVEHVSAAVAGLRAL